MPAVESETTVNMAAWVISFESNVTEWVTESNPNGVLTATNAKYFSRFYLLIWW